MHAARGGSGHSPGPGPSRAVVSCLAAGIAALVVAGTAFAATTQRAAAVHTVEALDAAGDPRWSPDVLTIDPGDTVRWTYGQANAAHQLLVPGYEEGPIRPPHSPEVDEVTFPTPGTFTYVCPLHYETMTGQVTVRGEPTPTPTPTATRDGDAAPRRRRRRRRPQRSPTAVPTAAPPAPPATPPPPPLPPVAADATPPALRSATVRVRSRTLRARFKLSEPAEVTLTAKRRGRRAQHVTRRLGSGTARLTLRLRRGRYAVTVVAEDAAGNRSARVRRTVRVS